MFFFNIDIVGTCNLKCPSCPVGNWGEFSEAGQYMSPELLSRVLDKAQSECYITGVGLFNWTEPLLHPNLPEMVSVVQSKGLPCYLSSNLNILKNVEEVFKRNLYQFRVSLSGFTQEIYSRTHRGGNIEKVKKNMYSLADIKQRTGCSTKIEVLYHRYLHNLGSEEQSMRDLSESLGFTFTPVWAFMMPLEKVLKILHPDNEITTGVHISKEDLELIESLALPIDKLETHLSLSRYKTSPCSLQDNQVTIDHKGEVQICCALYDSSKYTLAPYLETPLSELQAMKVSSAVCTKCMEAGIHKYVTYEEPQLEMLALWNVGQKQLSSSKDCNTISEVIF